MSGLSRAALRRQWRPLALIAVGRQRLVRHGPQQLDPLLDRWVGVEQAVCPAGGSLQRLGDVETVSYTHLRAHETVLDLVCLLLLAKKNTQHTPFT